jgi:hypothetical protein
VGGRNRSDRSARAGAFRGSISKVLSPAELVSVAPAHYLKPLCTFACIIAASSSYACS